ncbi:long-chain-fatty-acid--CoA ligase [Aeromicrobium marinum DSM 15272]|uniref:Long-chain-fatty-acid--CoA ligase n=1 Tax=Aeromicrobium marinum DSM 15272 TaxID=585531 RepID=E2SD92_9ACTN|nr:long-chain-fatty-acid--CoA ligase [Aeromicrobium marinum DSM 15272]
MKRKGDISVHGRTSPSVVHSVRVLLGSGVVDLRRPVLTLQSSLAVRTRGPIAGAAFIAARRRPDDVAVIDDDGPLTYGELDLRTNALARAITAAGVAEGDAVGVLCRDHRGVIEVMVAAGKSGARLVLLNTGFAPPQLADVLVREGVKLLIADAEFDALLAAAPDHVTTAVVGGPAAGPHLVVDDLVAAHSTDRLPAPSRQGGLVLLTGGTTGTPKGAPRQVGSPLAAAQFLERIPQRRGDVLLIAAPTFHGTGLSQLILAMALGSTVVLRRRFDAEATVRAVEQHRVTMLVLVPTMLQRILALEDLAAHDTSSLRIILCAGAALPAELGDRATAAFGPVVHNLYGCTEVALATVATPEDWAAAPGTAGRPPRGVQVALFDADDQPVTASGVSARIFVSNGLRFEGYSGGGTKPTIGAFMGTGDTGHWDDDGRLFVDGRDDDMIVSGGENVFPGEIEQVVGTLDGVVDVASLPVDDVEFGTRLRLFVVTDGSAPVDADLVKAHVRSHLARFKVPREVVVVEAIPYTPTGKVDRRVLATL